jgi:RsiW-degrading membrane proteinase PrsW (M82 family)
MAIVFRCGCGQKLSTRDDLAGRSVRCPGCAAVLKVPVPEPDPAAGNDQGYALVEPPTSPAPRPSMSEGFGASVSSNEPAERRPRPDSGAKRPGTPAATAPAARRDGKSPREYLYVVLALALVPLVFSVLAPKSTKIEERLKAAIEGAGPETAARLKSLQTRENVGLDDLLEALPGGKLDSTSHLPRATWVHWLYAAIAAAAFWVFALVLFPGEKKVPHHLLMVGLFTGTVGILLLIGFQFAASATQGMWLRGRGVIVILFYLVKFIGWSYASAGDPDSNLLLSFVGFTCGVGLCEELCKALPLLGYYRRDATMGWRNAAAWGLASGIGFGVAEGIMYSSRYYNGIASLDTYIVRFVSCVALHAIWTASVGITTWRRQETIQGDLDWLNYSVAVLQIVAVPMVLHGLYDTLLKKDLELWALAVGAASFAWFALQVEMARATDSEKEDHRGTAWT